MHSRHKCSQIASRRLAHHPEFRISSEHSLSCKHHFYGVLTVGHCPPAVAIRQAVHDNRKSNTLSFAVIDNLAYTAGSMISESASRKIDNAVGVVLSIGIVDVGISAEHRKRQGVIDVISHIRVQI